MKKETTIPSYLKERLEQEFQLKEPILCCGQTDRNTFGELAKGYIILTEARIFCALAPINDRQHFTYSEFPSKSGLFPLFSRSRKTFVNKSGEASSLENTASSYEIKEYLIEDIDSLHFSSHFNGSILYTEGKTCCQLGLFSNSCYPQLQRLATIFKAQKQGKPIDNQKEMKHDRPMDGPIGPGQNMPMKEQMAPKKQEKPKRATILRILFYFKPYTLQLIVMILCYLAISGLNLIWPYLNGSILYDKVLNKNNAFLEQYGLAHFATALALIVATMVMTKLMLQVLQIIQGIISSTIVPKVISHMRAEIFESMGRLSLSFFTSRETGTLMTRVLGDADRVTGFFVDILPHLFTNIFTILSTCIIMFMLNAKLALASLFLLPILVVISFKLLPQLFHLFGIRHRAERNMVSQINDNITGARVVKAFGQEDHEIDRFDKYNANVATSELLLVGFDNRFNALYTFVKSTISLIVWGVGAYLVLTTRNMEMGLLITFAGYVEQLNAPLDLMSRAVRSWTDSLNSAQRMFEIIDALPQVTEDADAKPFIIHKGAITLENVTFGYDEKRPVLRNLNLQVDGGSMLGIVGRSGAGKSTLVSLISRLYDPQQGRILIDGVDIRQMSFSDIRKTIAMVSQETYIFMGTVAQNISYANPKASREDILRAARLASAHDFISKLPNGYDTIIGSSGKSLSGGERQRLSIARAILADPKILILDEATASVDTETEKSIQRSLNYLIQNRTTLSIAHRLSTLRDADRLIVIDNGMITEGGTHQELVEQKGTYYKLMELQTKALAMKGIE